MPGSSKPEYTHRQGMSGNLGISEVLGQGSRWRKCIIDYYSSENECFDQSYRGLRPYMNMHLVCMTSKKSDRMKMDNWREAIY